MKFLPELREFLLEHRIIYTVRGRDVMKKLFFGYWLLSDSEGSRAIFTNVPDKIGIPIFYWSIFVSAILAGVFVTVSGLWALGFLAIPLFACVLFLFDGSD